MDNFKKKNSEVLDVVKDDFLAVYLTLFNILLILIHIN